MKTVKKVWGEEQWIANNKLYCGKILKLKKNYCCSYHAHPVKDETFYILSGEVLLRHADDKFSMLQKGDTVRIMPGEYHSFTGISDAVILEISTSHSDDDVIRKDKSRRVGDG